MENEDKERITKELEPYGIYQYFQKYIAYFVVYTYFIIYVYWAIIVTLLLSVSQVFEIFICHITKYCILINL